MDGDWRLVCVLEEKCKVEGDDGDGWVKADLIITWGGEEREIKNGASCFELTPNVFMHD